MARRECESMKKMFLLKMGIMMLLISAFCLVPVSAKDAFTTTLVADKDVYSPGDTITYKVLLDVNTGEFDPWFDLYTADFDLDSNIESVTNNMPDYCSISGNEIFCESVPGDPQTADGLWNTPPDMHRYLWVVKHSQPVDYNVHFTITGKIKQDTPDNTIIKSTAHCIGLEESGIPDPDWEMDYYSVSEVNVVRSQNAPEFPSLFLPITLIVGFLGVVLLIQRTKEK